MRLGKNAKKRARRKQAARARRCAQPIVCHDELLVSCEHPVSVAAAIDWVRGAAGRLSVGMRSPQDALKSAAETLASARRASAAYERIAVVELPDGMEGHVYSTPSGKPLNVLALGLMPKQADLAALLQRMTREARLAMALGANTYLPPFPPNPPKRKCAPTAKQKRAIQRLQGDDKL